MTIVREATAFDHYSIAVLHNATHEPHFHISSADLAALERDPAVTTTGRLVAERDGTLIGTVSFSLQDFDRPNRLWLDLAIHPDHTRDDTAKLLVNAVTDQAVANDMRSLWISIREDYLDAWPAPATLGFDEVHRTFGGGFFLTSHRTFDGVATPGNVRLATVDSVLSSADGSEQLTSFFQLVHRDKVLAPPTIESGPDSLDLSEALTTASFAAFSGTECIGLCIVEPSHLGAWAEVVAVREDVRRQGIGRALLAAALTQLQAAQIGFLNTAGVRSDSAYIGLLQSHGATIEPDWIAFERVI